MEIKDALNRGTAFLFFGLMMYGRKVRQLNGNTFTKDSDIFSLYFLIVLLSVGCSLLFLDNKLFGTFMRMHIPS